MLYGCSDAAQYAGEQRFVAEPGQKWQLSSGSTGLLARVIRTVVGDPALLSFTRRELFDKLQMASVVIEPDPSGTLVLPMHVYATPRDWARFGLLYAQGGVYGGQRVLSPNWVKYTATPTPAADHWGAHFWLNTGRPGYPGSRQHVRLPTDALFAYGQQGSALVVVPSLELVIVRIGQDVDPEWKWNPTVFFTTLEPFLRPRGQGVADR